MNIKHIKKIASTLAIFTFSVLLIQSCKKPDNTVGSGFIDGELINTGIYRKAEILAFTSKQERVITSKTDNSLVGVYQDPVFGQIRSSVAAQVKPQTINPDFGLNPVIDSVVLTMPYLGKEIGDSILVYDTDSIYGNYNIPIHLRVAELNRFLRSDSTYYSDIDLPTSNTLYETSDFLPPYVNTIIDGEFKITMDSLILFEHNRLGEITDTNVIAPAVRLHLDKEFFQERILDRQGTADLASYLNFLNYFNGIVIESNSADGAIFSFDLTTNVSDITIYYKNDDVDDEGEAVDPREFKLNFDPTYVKVNKYEFNRANAHPSLVAQLNDDYDTTKGSNMLFLQGLDGIQADIKLFTDKEQLDSLRAEKLLINEANLVYRVSAENGSKANVPYKLLMVNRDSVEAGGYYTMIDQEYNNIYFDGNLRSDPKVLYGEKRYYKFRITHYVNDILNGRLESSEEGQNIVYGENYPIRLIAITGADSPARVMLNSNLSSENNNGDSDLYLEIFYSEKNN